MIILLVIVIIILIYDIIPTCVYKIKYLLNRSRRGKVIYLTFDDGPSKYTESFLDVLNKYKVKATFFVVSDFVKYHSNIIDRMKLDGHLVGVHSKSHKNAWFMGPLRTYRDFMESISFVNTEFYRPPWGNINLMIFYLIKRYDVNMLLWDVMVGDWKDNITSREIVKKLLTRVHGGDIICLHDGRGKNDAPKKTLNAINEVIPILLEKGYVFRKLDEYEK